MLEKRFNHLEAPLISQYEDYLPTAFSSELTLLQKVNKIIQDLNRSFDLTNEMVDYLNSFIETFDEKLYENIYDILNMWLSSGVFNDIMVELIVELKRYGDFVLNPEIFRKTGEETDNSVFKQCVDYAQEKQLPFALYRDYHDIESFEINRNQMIQGNGHYLYTKNTEHKNDVFFKVSSIIEDPIHDDYTIVNIYNLRLVSTNCQYGVGLNNYGAEVNINNMLVRGFNEKNVYYQRKRMHGNGEINFLTCEKSKVGIDLSATDVKLRRYQGRDCITHILQRGGGNYICDVHGWGVRTEKEDWVTDSVLIDIQASCTISNAYGDTVETVLKLRPNIPYILISVTNLNYFLNRDFYPSQSLKPDQNPPKLIRGLDEFTGKISILGIQVDNQAWKHADGSLTTLFDGTIVKSRMTFTGLTNNGFIDNLFLNEKTVYLNDETVLEENKTYLSRYFNQCNVNYDGLSLSISASYKKEVPPNTQNFYYITLSLPININNSLLTVNSKTSDGGQVALGGIVEGNTIKISNNTNKTLAGILQLSLRKVIP